MRMIKKFRDLGLPLKISIVISGIIAAVALAFLFGLFVMLLWNWLMPDIFGLRRIGYWQAWGLVLLSHILFKSWGGRHWGPRRRRVHARLERELNGSETKPAPSGEA